MLVFPAFLVLMSTSFLPQQEGMSEEVLAGCRRCDERGVVDCTGHQKVGLLEEYFVPYCSVAARCRSCLGALVLDCPHCDGGPDSMALEARKALVAQWLNKESAPEVVLKKTFLRLETDAFRLLLDVAKVKNEKKMKDPHRFAHFLMRRLEGTADLFRDHFQAKPHHLISPISIWWFSDAKEKRKVMEDVLLISSGGDIKKYTRNPVYCADATESAIQSSGPMLEAATVHNAVHILLFDMFRESWIGEKKAGWFDAGASHWYEEYFCGRVSNYCIAEANSMVDWKNGVWRSALRKWLAREEGPVLPALVNQHTGQLMPRDHALSWSLFDWVVHNHPKVIQSILMAYKEHQPTRDIFKEHLSMTVRQVEEAWRKWVQQSYPTKDPKVKRRKFPKAKP